jgi:hypothetical protein
LVFTCARIAREPAVIPSAAVRTLTRRFNTAFDISSSPDCGRKTIRNGDKDEESQCARYRTVEAFLKSARGQYDKYDIAGASLRPAGTAVTLAGDPQDTNSIDAPERMVPKASQITGVKSGFTNAVPANGIVVLELGTR